MSRPLLLLLVAAVPAPAQDHPPAERSTIRYDATTMIVPAGTHDLRAVVDATAKFLQRNILTDPRELAGGPATIELQTALQLDAAHCEEAVSELLFSRGFVLVPRDEQKGLYEVVLLGGPRGRDVCATAPHRTPEQVMARPKLQQPVTTLVTLHTVDATVATNALRPFFAARGGAPAHVVIGTAGDNRSLLLSGIQSEVAAAIELVRQVDGPPPDDARTPAPRDLERKVAELEKTVASLAQRLAELEKRLAGDARK